jgi:hypothetical protein
MVGGTFQQTLAMAHLYLEGVGQDHDLFVSEGRF